MADEERADEGGPVILEAALLAVRAHAGQVRKGGDVPYSTHPLEVARLVRDAGGSQAAQAAALLHDVLEDTEAGREAVAAFGPEVLALVDALTDPPDRAALPMADRKAAQAAHIAAAAPDARLIKLADQTANLADLAATLDAWRPARAAAYLAGARAVAAACAGVAPTLDARFAEMARAVDAALAASAGAAQV